MKGSLIVSVTETSVSIDIGTGYERPLPDSDHELVEVARGTAGGELLRRYWQPFGLSSYATDIPRNITLLGEDLVLFRDGKGRPGLVHNRCCHRGTTLYYGKVEDDGIRCCYHGWLFDVEGRTLDMPCEPANGLHAERYRQPWYPVTEYHGMLFAYMGPPEHKPTFPTYDIFDDVPAGWEVVADDNNIGLEGDPTPCNWFQTHENVMDPFHVFVLHSGFSGNQFVPEMGITPDISWYFTDYGVKSHQDRVLDNGDMFHRVTEVLVPNVRIVASPFAEYTGQSNSVAWTVPISKIECKILTMLRQPIGTPTPRALHDGKLWAELTEEEHQRYPGDFEAQVGQGAVTLHSEEHLASSDRGVTMFRRSFRQAIKAMADGGNPPFTSQDPDEPRYTVLAGNYIGPPDEVMHLG